MHDAAADPRPPAAAAPGPPAPPADDALDEVPCGLLTIGRDETITDANQTFLRWTGHARATLLGGRRFADLLTVPGKIFYSTQFGPLLQLQGAVLEVAFDVRRADGTTLPILVNAVVRPEAPGRPASTRMAVFSATQRRRYERELLQARKTAERLAAVVAFSGDAVFSVDARGDIDTWNGGAEQLFGTPARTALGQPLTGTVLLGQSADLSAVMDRARHGGPAGVVELELPRTGGQARWVSVAVAAIRDAMDRVTGLSAIARDITDRRTAERLRADEATARHAAAVAEAARAAALAASQAKSDFLANMSHEIRTPLNGVVGMLQLLAGTPLDAGQRQRIDVARSSAAALLTLINDILDLSKVEAGKLELDPVPFDLVDVVEAAVAIVAPKAEGKRLALACHLDPGLARRRVGPADRVRQVLINLLGNAVKFTPAGSVTLSVTAEAGDGLLRFAVTDTGIGIPPDRLGRLFQTFSQVDAGTARQYGGTGLGLAISRQLAGLMGGAVGVASTAGAGSTFWFTAALPIDTAPPTAGPAPVAVAAGGGGGRRVLVAEDNDVNQMVVEEMLRRLGYATDVVGDGRAAVEAADGGAYDLVLMDCQMPVMDGFAAAAAIRAAEAAGPDRRRLPVIALTANAIKGDRERCLAAGMDDYLSKPIDADQLAAKLAAWLAPARAAA